MSYHHFIDAVRSAGLSRRLRTVALLGCSALALASCGGESESGNGPVTLPTPTPTATPSPTPTPTPTATPTPTSNVATFTEGTIPGTQTMGAMIHDLTATNRGLYMIHGGDLTNADRVIKLHGDPSSSNAWTAVTPDSTVSARLDIAPSNIYSEGDRAIFFYWRSQIQLPNGGPDGWGSYTANTGGVSVTIREPEGVDQITADHVAAGANTGIVASRPWIVDGSFQVRQDDGQYTAENSITDRFSTAAQPPLPGVVTALIAHRSDPELYVATGNRLFTYDASAMVHNWTFPADNAGDAIYDLIWNDNDLYIGFGNKLYVLRSGATTITSVGALNSVASIPGRFCIQRGEAFLSSGEAINLQTGARRDWISQGTLSTAAAATAASLRASAAGGVYCSQTGSVIYSLNLEAGKSPTIRMVTPLAR